MRKGDNLKDKHGISSQARVKEGFVCDLMKNRDLSLELPTAGWALCMLVPFSNKSLREEMYLIF